jgi:hypothetical protein
MSSSKDVAASLRVATMRAVCARISPSRAYAVG